MGGLAGQHAGGVEDAVPIERRAGVGLVGLDVVVPEQAVEVGELLRGECAVEDACVGAARGVEGDAWQVPV